MTPKVVLPPVNLAIFPATLSPFCQSGSPNYQNRRPPLGGLKSNAREMIFEIMYHAYMCALHLPRAPQWDTAD